MVLESEPLSVGSQRGRVWHACFRPFTTNRHHIETWGCAQCEHLPRAEDAGLGSVNTPKTTPGAQGRWGTTCQCCVTSKPENCCHRPPSQSKSQQLSRTEHWIRGRPVPISHFTARYFTYTSPPTMRQVHFMKLETGSEEWSNRLEPMPGPRHSLCS